MKLANQRKAISTAIIVSLFLHFLFLYLGYIYFLKYDVDVPEETIIELDLTEDKMKIADILKPKVEKRPEKSKHIGMYDSAVKEETVASQSVRAPLRPESRGGEGAEDIQKRIEEFSSSKEFTFNKTKPEEKKKARVMTRSMPEDYYPDYKRGKHTYINVLKHQDVAYFVRLKRVFKLAWDPVPVLRQRRMMGEVSRGSIKVVVGITIKRDGAVEELFVLNSSGIRGYDQEALRTVRVSEPFSAPPKKLLEQDGKIHLAWTFVVYM